jgi:tetratricopeptide (TPR) repeat protein
LCCFLSVLKGKAHLGVFSGALRERWVSNSTAHVSQHRSPTRFATSFSLQLTASSNRKTYATLGPGSSATRQFKYRVSALPHGSLLSKQLTSSADREPERSDPLERARSALSEGRAREAERIADELLKVNARDALALRIRGAALLMQTRASEAVPALENAARSLRDAETDTLLAMALRLCGRSEDALTRFKRATKRLPPYPSAFYEFADVLMSLGRHEEAIDVLRRGLEIAPMMSRLSVQLGEVFLRRRDYVQAKIAFGKALEIATDSADALFGIGRAHHALGENLIAADYYRRCLRAQPDHTAAWLNLGNCLLQLRDTEAGCECFRTAARREPRSYGIALNSLAAAGRGRLWLKPSAAARFLIGKR